MTEGDGVMWNKYFLYRVKGGQRHPTYHLLDILMCIAKGEGKDTYNLLGHKIRKAKLQRQKLGRMPIVRPSAKRQIPPALSYYIYSHIEGKRREPTLYNLRLVRCALACSLQGGGEKEA